MHLEVRATMRKELYDDVMEEEPQDYDTPQAKKWSKRLDNSIGRVIIERQGVVFAKHDKTGKLKPCSDVLTDEIVYDVNDEQGAMTCDDQNIAMIYALLVQVNARLKRVEKKLGEKNGN